MTNQVYPRSQGRMRRLGTVYLGFIVGFLGIAFMLVLWSVVLAPVLNQREDNPRVVAQELSILRGSIWASEDVEVARTVGPETERRREYPYPYIGPAVGYYSFIYGTAGVEAGYDTELRGDSGDAWAVFWRDLLHLPQNGRDVRITLDTNWQRWADSLMGENKGALVLLTTSDNAVRAMVSKPAYDPNRLEADFEKLAFDESGPLLNRVAQSQYQPGMALQPFLMAEGLASGDLSLEEEVENAAQPIMVNGAEISCQTEPSVPVTWSSVLKQACPAPMVALGDAWGNEKLNEVFAAFGFTNNPNLPINTQVPVPLPVVDAGLAGIGQDNLVVTPLQMSLALATLANSGVVNQPLLVTAVQDEAGVWQVLPRGQEMTEVVPAGAATEIVGALPRPESIIAEHVIVALSGPQEGQLVWYLGLAPANDPLYAVVIVLEESNNMNQARSIGRNLLQLILAPEESN